MHNMPRQTKDKLETVGKVYDSNDLVLGDISMWTKSHAFQFASKDGKTTIDSESLVGLTEKEMRGKVKWMYIRYKRTKSFDVRDHFKKSTYKKPHWQSDDMK